MLSFGPLIATTLVAVGVYFLCAYALRRRVTPPPPRNFVCAVCKRPFRTFTALSIHLDEESK